MFTENQVKGGLNTVDRQLLYDIRELLKEQNQLLKMNLENKQANPAEIDEFDKMKRPDLMKLMSTQDAPQGWNKWGNEKMINYLRGKSNENR